MLWASKPLAAKSRSPASLCTGIDLNSSRVRAVRGSADLPPRLVSLDDESEELPLAVSLENRHPKLGRAGIRLSRLMPHLVCQDYLGVVGEERSWGMGRQRLN